MGNDKDQSQERKTTSDSDTDNSKLPDNDQIERPSDCALSNLIINLSVYHDGPSNILGNGTTFLGQVNIPLSSVITEISDDGRSKDYTKWHLLQPRSKVSKGNQRDHRISTLQSTTTLPSVSDYQSAISTLPKMSSYKNIDNDLGSLRLKINHISDYVLNSRY